MKHTPREQGLKRAALLFVRKWGFKGDRLPRGVRDNSTECPIGNATGWIIANPFALMPDEGNHTILRLPQSVVQFIDLFDRGRYPELERKTVGT